MIETLARPEGVSIRVLLVRHGEPESSSRGRCYGKLNVGLSDGGRRQMTRLARSLEGMELEAIYASPRERALESADIVARTFGLEPRVDGRLSEMDFGRIEGMRYDDVAREHPELYERWMHRPTDVKFPEGESFAEMRVRVLAAFTELGSRHHDRTVAIVSHGGVNRIVLADALGLPDDAIFRLGQTYAGLSVVDYYGAECVVRLLNGVVP